MEHSDYFIHNNVILSSEEKQGPQARMEQEQRVQFNNPLRALKRRQIMTAAPLDKNRNG